MNDLLRAKCYLYAELLKEYDGEKLPAAHDCVLMDALMRDVDVQRYLASVLKGK